MIYYASALAKKLSELSSNAIESMLLSNASSERFKVILLQCSVYESIKLDYDRLSCLLEDPGTGYEVKANIINNMLEDTTASYLSAIEKTALDLSDERLANLALRRLYLRAPERAIEISDDILNGYKAELNSRTLTAIQVKAGEYKKDVNAAGEKEFADFCTRVINGFSRLSPEIANKLLYIYMYTLIVITNTDFHKHHLLYFNISGKTLQKKKNHPIGWNLYAGDNLSSRAAARQVFSAHLSLTTVFGMGTGGTSML